MCVFFFVCVLCVGAGMRKVGSMLGERRETVERGRAITPSKTETKIRAKIGKTLTQRNTDRGAGAAIKRLLFVHERLFSVRAARGKNSTRKMKSTRYNMRSM